MTDQTDPKSRGQVWGDHLSVPPDQRNIRFCAGRDVQALPMADAVLLDYDIWTNMAHACMLERVGVIRADELNGIRDALVELQKLAAEGCFQLDPAKEDVHINIEHYITAVRGVEAGKKLHSARSRNDQVTTDMRLFLRHRLLCLAGELREAIATILSKAEGETETVMPGFTHYQPAMPTTVAHWFSSWSQALIRDLESLSQQLTFLNRSPLGAAAAFGTSWPIDRELTAALLGFDGVDANTLDCISSRGENESRVTACIAVMMNHFSNISQDLILFSNPFFGMIELDDRYVTGSSIMPQKRNPDFAELIRGKAALAHGCLTSLLGIQKGAMSGYNRDTQATKYLIMDLLREVEDVPAILAGVVGSLDVKRDVMAQRCHTGFLASADIADWLAQRFNLAFRDCYHLVATAVKYSDGADQVSAEGLKRAVAEHRLPVALSDADFTLLTSPAALIRLKRHSGGPAPEATMAVIQLQRQRLSELESEFERVARQAEEAKKRCFQA